MFFLDCLHKLTQEHRATDTRHIFQTDFWSSRFDKLFCNVGIIFYGMARRESDTKSSLRNHATFLGILNGRNDISYIVQTTENTGNINSLLIFHFIHQLTHIGRNRIHTQPVQATVKHVGLDTRFMQRLSESTDCLVRIFAIQQIDLFESTPIRFHSGKTTHFNDYWSNASQLVCTWLIFTRGLPHIAVDQTEFDFFLHKLV